MHRKHFQLAMLAVTLCLNLAGQTAGAGTITGTITDPSGAVVPAATVAVKHTATQTERTLASNEPRDLRGAVSAAWPATRLR